MLQAALDSDVLSDEAVEPGAKVRDSAELVFDALARMEKAIIAWRERAGKEVHRLREEKQELMKKHTSLTDQLKETQGRQASVSAQVNDLSARLDALIARLAKVLEEQAA